MSRDVKNDRKKFGDSFREILSTESTLADTADRIQAEISRHVLPWKINRSRLPRDRGDRSLAANPSVLGRASYPVNSNKRDASSCRGMKINDRGVTGGGGASGLYPGCTEGGRRWVVWGVWRCCNNAHGHAIIRGRPVFLSLARNPKGTSVISYVTAGLCVTRVVLRLILHFYTLFHGIRKRLLRWTRREKTQSQHFMSHPIIPLLRWTVRQHSFMPI